MPEVVETYAFKSGSLGNPEEIVREHAGVNRCTFYIGKEKVVEVWRSEGAPVIHLRPGENCSDLEKLLSNRYVKSGHLEAVREWLEKVLKRRGEQC